MNNLVLKIDCDIEHDEFWYQTNVERKSLQDFICKFVLFQLHKSSDMSELKEADFYSLTIELDVARDCFSYLHNCGNAGLATGIVMAFRNRISTSGL